jgi:hypothetical protein
VKFPTVKSVKTYVDAEITTSNGTNGTALAALKADIDKINTLEEDHVYLGNSSDEATETPTTGSGDVVRAISPTLTGTTTLDGALSVSGATTLDSTLDVTAAVNLNDTTQSTDTTNGALIVDGGVGIAQNLNVGGNFEVTGTTTAAAINVNSIFASGKLTVTGATTLNGGLTMGLGDFTVAPFSGNTVIGGTLSVTGGLTGNVTGNVTGGLTGDVYASDGTSKILESGTDGTDAIFTGDVTGNITGNAATVNNGVYTTSSVAALSDVTSAGSGAIITAAERIKLDGVDAAADVTNATNVAAAGAVMNTGDETIAGVKTFSSTISGSIAGNADTATKIASITNTNIVQLTETQTLTNKTLTSPTLVTPTLGVASATSLTASYLKATDNTSSITAQGVYSMWNLPSASSENPGAASFVNSIGLGIGGFNFFNVSTGTTLDPVATPPIVAFSPSGEIKAGAVTYTNTTGTNGYVLTSDGIGGTSWETTTNANLTGVVQSSGNTSSFGTFSSGNLQSALTDD